MKNRKALVAIAVFSFAGIALAFVDALQEFHNRVIFHNTVTFDQPVVLTGGVTGNISLTGNLVVPGDAGVAGSLTVGHDAGILGNLWVGGDAGVARNLLVYGDAGVVGGLTVGTAVNVTGAAAATCGLTVPLGAYLGFNGDTCTQLLYSNAGTLSTNMNTYVNGAFSANSLTGLAASSAYSLKFNTAGARLQMGSDSRYIYDNGTNWILAGAGIFADSWGVTAPDQFVTWGNGNYGLELDTSTTPDRLVNFIYGTAGQNRTWEVATFDGTGPWPSGVTTRLKIHSETGDVDLGGGVLYTDNVNNRVGVNDTTPSTALDVNGTTSTTSLVVGAGTTLTKLVVVPVTADVTNIAGFTCLDTTGLSVPGAATTSSCWVSPAAMDANVALGGVWGTGADTVTMRLCNVTAVGIDPGSHSYIIGCANP